VMEYWSNGVRGYKEQPILQYPNTPILHRATGE
jgi:hypothetical protein